MEIRQIEDRRWCVYIHTNKINGKKYVGQTSQNPPEKRWGNNGSNYDSTPYFFSAINKYGWDNFEHEIIQTNLTLTEALSLESELIASLDTTNKDKGYNIIQYGIGTIGYKHTEEAKQKMSNAKKGRPPANKGKKATDESRKKMSQAHVGKKLTEEQKKKIGENSKTWWAKDENREKMSGKNNSRYGVKMSSETKQKISKANKGKKLTDDHVKKLKESHIGITQSEKTKKKISDNSATKRNIVQLSLDGTFIASYSSLKNAEQQTGIKYQNISACLRETKQSAGGFLWLYQEKYNPDVCYEYINTRIRPVVQLTKDMKLVNKYKSITEASQITGFSTSSIGECCSGTHQYSHGYLFMYEEKYIDYLKGD